MAPTLFAGDDRKGPTLNPNSIIQQSQDGVLLNVKVVPGAARSRIVGVLGDALKLQVSAPPERGKANAAVVQLIASALGIPEAAVEVSKGHASARKSISVRGVTVADARSRLGIL